MLIKNSDELLASGRLMGLDHGSKTIGVAITDAERRMAQPVETIRCKKFAVDVTRLKALIDEHQPVALIIGYPLNMDGSEGPRCQSVRAFVRNLESHIDLPMLMWDERLSSAAAEDAMKDAELRTAQRHAKRDAAAAAMILESLLAHLTEA